MARPTALERKTHELAKAQADADELGRQLTSARLDADEARAEANRWRNERLADPEAEALSGCVRAINAMYEAQADRESRVRGGSVMAQPMRYSPEFYGTRYEVQPSPLDHPVGRILLALAARHGLAIAPVPAEPVEVPGQRLMSVPAELADQVEQLVNQVALR